MNFIQTLYEEAKIQKFSLFEISSNFRNQLKYCYLNNFMQKCHCSIISDFFKSILQYSNFRNTQNHFILKKLKESKKHKRRGIGFSLRILVNILSIYLHITILNSPSLQLHLKSSNNAYSKKFKLKTSSKKQFSWSHETLTLLFKLLYKDKKKQQPSHS